MVDKSISVESVKNAAIVDPTRNSAACTLVKIETLSYYVAPVQTVFERKEVT